MKTAHRSQLPPVHAPTLMPPVQELAVVPQRTNTLDDIIYALIASKASIAELREFYALKREFEKDEAMKAYVDAMAEAKKNPPEILKKSVVDFTNKEGKRTNYMHADLGEVCDQVISWLGEYGFSHSWIPGPPGPKIEVTCKLTHRLGHSESVPLSGPSDTTGNKNAIQSDQSTRQYLQRYSLLMITGLSTKGMDNDGRGAEANADDNPNPHQAWIDCAAAISDEMEYGRRLEEVKHAFGSAAKVPQQIQVAFGAAKQRVQAAHGGAQ